MLVRVPTERLAAIGEELRGWPGPNRGESAPHRVPEYDPGASSSSSGYLASTMMILSRKRYQPLFERLHRVALRGLGFGNPNPATNGEYALLGRLAAEWSSPIVI